MKLSLNYVCQWFAIHSTGIDNQLSVFSNQLIIVGGVIRDDQHRVLGSDCIDCQWLRN